MLMHLQVRETLVLLHIYWVIMPFVGILGFGYASAQWVDVRAEKPGTSWSCSGVYKRRIPVIVPLRVCRGPNKHDVFTRVSVEILRPLEGNNIQGEREQSHEIP